MPDDGKGGDSKDKSNADQGIVIEVDGEKKEFKSEDVKNLLAQQASATQAMQSVSAVKTAAEKYEMSPEEYVEQAEGVFATVTALLEQGLINEKGEVVKKELKETPKVPKTPTTTKFEMPEELKETLEKINERLGGVEEDQTRLLRVQLGKDIREKHSELNQDDVSRLFAVATQDRKKSIWQHAEDMVEAKRSGELEAKKKFAEEFGINLEEWEANKVKEQDAKGGGAVAVLGGRKLSFKKDKEGKTVTPREAMVAYFAGINKKE